jgi:protein-S-isoprenylcysteine O-methyltransferase Ste14
MSLISDSLWERILLPARWIFFIALILGASLHPREALRDPLIWLFLIIILFWRTYEHIGIGLKRYRFLKDPGKHTIAMPAISLWIGCSLPIFDYFNLPAILPRVTSLRAIGIGLLILGIGIRVICIRTLGRFFTAHLRVNEGRRLIQEGIYKHLRHPSYFGMIFSFLGLPLVFCSLYGVLCMIFIGIPSLLFRINLEERFLVEEFGEEYLEYRKHTYKLIPFVY